jgi:hypothetical protein
MNASMPSAAYRGYLSDDSIAGNGESEITGLPTVGGAPVTALRAA